MRLLSVAIALLLALPASARDEASKEIPATAKKSARKAPAGKPEEPSPEMRRRIAALALEQVAFGSISLLPVRFENSRLAGPFEDGGRRLYCVSSHMKGRTFGKAERPKAVFREEAGLLTVLDDDEVCQGHRTRPFEELDTPKDP